jgi:formamidopyrimidine-DNA glycosylase
MPEFPDVELYLECLAPRVLGQPLEGVRLASPFLLRTVEPPLAAAVGRKVEALRRLGKRIVVELEDELFLVVHLMIAGRLRWRPPRPVHCCSPRRAHANAPPCTSSVARRVSRRSIRAASRSLRPTSRSSAPRSRRRVTP